MSVAHGVQLHIISGMSQVRSATAFRSQAAVTLFCVMPGCSDVQRNVRVSLNVHLRNRENILGDDTGSMIPRSEVLQLSTEETHCVYWEDSWLNSGGKVVLPVLFCLQSESWPFGVPAKIPSNARLWLVCCVSSL